MEKITCVIRTLTCGGALLDTPVELSTIDMRVEVLIIVSGVAVDLLMDRLADIARIMRTDVSVGGRECKRVCKGNDCFRVYGTRFIKGVLLLSGVWLSVDGCCLGLRQLFAGPDALEPCMIMFGVASTSAVSEPRTAATAATAFPRFSDGTAFRAYRIDRRRCGCSLVTQTKKQTENAY